MSEIIDLGGCGEEKVYDRAEFRAKLAELVAMSRLRDGISLPIIITDEVHYWSKRDTK